MPLSLTKIPHDILLLICIRLGYIDLLSFAQTCRVVHAIADSDYVWHHLNHNLPLDLSAVPSGDISSLSGTEIKQLVIKALRLDSNWQNKRSKVTRLRRIDFRDVVLQMQPVGAKWLVTLSRKARAPNPVHLSVWHLADSTTDASLAMSTLVAQFPLVRALKFVASLQDDGNTLLITVLRVAVTQGGMSIFKVCLTDPPLFDDQQNLLYIREVTRRGIMYDCHISGPLIAASLVQAAPKPTLGQGSFSSFSQKQELIFVNTSTNATAVVELPQTSANPDGAVIWFRLYPPYIVIFGRYDHEFKVLVYEIPVSILGESMFPWTPSVQMDAALVEDLAAAVAEYRLQTTAAEVAAVCGPGSFAKDLAFVLSRIQFDAAEKGELHIYRFPSSAFRRGESCTNVAPIHTLNTPPGATLEFTCMGSSGYRAVWMEHQWATDDYTLVKASFPYTLDSDAVAGTADLLSADVVFPFELQHCRLLAFQEETGRVVASLHTGEIYLIDF